MERIDLPKVDHVPERIQSVAKALGLESQQFPLAKYPGCTHWHFRKEGKTGTLEATYWPKTGEAWLTLRSNRSAQWVEPVAEEFYRLVEADARTKE